MRSLPDKFEPPILAIDWGSRRLGIAISPDGLHGFIRPHIEAANTNEAIEAVSRLVKDEKIKTVLMGLPISMDGSEGGTAKQVRRFGQLLTQQVKVAIRYQDERLTSKMSSRLVPGAGKGKSDSLAAMLILESAMKA